jgi:hypothetical protein
MDQQRMIEFYGREVLPKLRLPAWFDCREPNCG